ncbi:Flp pilus assembly protein CpaB [Aestuariivirga sp.]|uniref:Flp pilus assembly protein CpaB n=1 Tax=Aestuariivirga sp. TaxID=2650926 RepID=UPI00391D9010
MIAIRRGTLVTLLIALVFGGIAVFIAKIWLDVQQQRAAVVAVTPQPAKVETSTIVVATQDLKFGEPLNPELLREIPWPKDSVPQGAFAKVADINKEGRRVVLSPIGPNEPVLAWKISGPGARASLSALVNEGMRAVTVRVNDYSGVAGFVLPGDRVDVLYTREEGDATIDILLQNVRVLAIDQVADEKKSDPQVARVATLELTPTDAQKVSLAQSTGALTLTLRAAGSLDQAPPQRIVEQELVSNPSVYQAAFDAQAEAQAALDQKVKGLEGTLLQRLAALENTVQMTAKATGEGEETLRSRLAELEAAIREASSATGQGEEALRSRLAEFENRLRQMVGESRNVALEAAPSEELLPTTAQVRIYRGLDSADYTVPLDANPQ